MKAADHRATEASLLKGIKGLAPQDSFSGTGGNIFEPHCCQLGIPLSRNVVPQMPLHTSRYDGRILMSHQ